MNATEGFGGQSALMWAAAQKQPAMIRLLLEHGADVDARGIAREWDRKVTAEPRIKIMQNGGFTPLLYAAREGCAECVAALVAGGADIDLADPDGMTPLVLALLNRNFDTAAELIERGADVNRWDWWGRSPLYLAIELNRVPEQPPRRPAVARRCTRASTLRGRCSLAARTSTCGSRTSRRCGMSPATAASSTAAPTRWSSTPAPRRCTRPRRRATTMPTRLLLEHGASVNPRNVFGITPFLAAAGVGRVYGIFKEYPVIGRYLTAEQAVGTMKILLAAGANADERSKAGLTAAHGAAQAGWPAVLRYLDEIGADLVARNLAKQTPRDLAVEAEKKETVAVIDELLAR